MYTQKIKRIFAIVLMINCIFCISPMITEVKADNFDFSVYEDVKGNTEADQIAKKAVGTGVNIIRIVATGISIVMLGYIGIKYMMAAPDEKAEFKRSATIFILGAILVFAAGNILQIIANFASESVK